eukprot:6537695-Alexandrium_andersonii.AAC.1
MPRHCLRAPPPKGESAGAGPGVDRGNVRNKQAGFQSVATLETPAWEVDDEGPAIGRGSAT